MFSIISLPACAKKLDIPLSALQIPVVALGIGNEALQGTGSDSAGWGEHCLTHLAKCLSKQLSEVYIPSEVRELDDTFKAETEKIR